MFHKTDFREKNVTKMISNHTIAIKSNEKNKRLTGEDDTHVTGREWP